MSLKNRLLFLSLLIGICFAVNSCKKEKADNIKALLSNETWQLASLQVFHFVGDTQLPTDTLNTKCDTTQLFTFFKDGTCTYTNFHCKPQPIAKGSWNLNDTRLVLLADMVCQDTTKAGSSKPFSNSQVVNLGEFSLVLQTGDTQAYYTATQPRTIYRYGFIKQKRNTR